MLLDRNKPARQWLDELKRGAEATYGTERAAQLEPALERLAHALASLCGAERRGDV